MKLHLPKGLLVAVLAAMTGFTQSAWGAYETLADQMHEVGSIPTHSTSVNSLTNLVYDNNPSDGRVVSNADIVVNNSLWVGPGAGNTHSSAQKPILVQLKGLISGSGTLKFNEYPSAAANFVIYELTNSSSTFSGTVSLEHGHNTHADVQVNLNGVGTAYAGATFGTSSAAHAILNIASSVSVAGLKDGASDRVTSTSTSNTLTLAGSGTYSYAGTLGSGTYHTYALGDSSTTFDTAASAALNIDKSGTGTQTFTGTANLGSVTVNAGILNFNGTTTFDGNISVDNAGTLNIYSAVTLNGSVTGALSIADMSGFQSSGQGSYAGGEVEGNGFLTDTFTIISSDSTTKEGVSIAYKGETYITNAAGAISTQNKDIFYIWSDTEKLSTVLGAGANTIQTSAGTVLNIDTNETTAGHHILPSVSGSGTVEIELADNSKEAAITGTSFAGFTGTVDVKAGQLYVGQYNNGGGVGAAATVGAERFIVRSGASLWTHLGGNDQTLSSDIDLLSGSALRNRDGSSTLSGDIRFNIKDPSAETPEYNSAGSVELSTHWEKNLTLTGLISGDGQVNITTPAVDEDTAPASTWKLTNNGNTFQGSYNLAGRTKLILGAENAARNATINLNGGSSVATLELAQNATIKALNSEDADSVVTTTAAAALTVSEGSFAGKLQDGSSTNKLSLKKTGTGTLTLSGANTYSGGTEITGGTLIVSSGSSLGSGDVSITNATVEANHTSNNGTSIIGGGAVVSINTGGTLKLSGHDMLGWGNNSPAKIILGSDDATKVAKLDIDDTDSLTMKPAIEMNGNAEITGNKLNTYGISLTVKKGTNKIKVATLQMRHNLEIAIAQEAVLTIESLIAPNTAKEESHDIIKSDVGTLELTNTGNTWNKNMHVTGGTLRLVGAANLPGSVTMDSGTRLETGTGTIGNLTMADGSTLDADTAVELSGTLTFNGVVNLDGAIKDALYAGAQTVKLFTGITSLVLNGTTYDSTARVAYNPVNLEEVFTFAGLQEDKYQLHYSGGELFATCTVPEPATATLSLLALAGLCARRRRKS